MSTLPPTTTEQHAPLLTRTDTVVMGRLDFFSVLLRLIGVELYKIRRRMMSKVLSTVSILIMLVSFAGISLGATVVLYSPVENFLPPQCSSVQIQPCLSHPPTDVDLAQAKQAKQETLDNVSGPLRLPASFDLAMQITRTLGLILIIILAGTIVGGEYSVGTIRLMFTRGPTRTQFLLAKIGAILTCVALSFLVLVPLGILTGALLNLITGINVDFSFLTGTWILHAVLDLLVSMLGVFMYTMLAFCLSTLGRATVAGVAGALIWWALEGALSGILVLVGSLNKGGLGDFVKAIPDYFVGNNIAALTQNQEHYLSPGTLPAQLSDLHALLVLAVHLALSIGLAWWVIKRRDITN